MFYGDYMSIYNTNNVGIIILFLIVTMMPSVVCNMLGIIWVLGACSCINYVASRRFSRKFLPLCLMEAAFFAGIFHTYLPTYLRSST